METLERIWSGHAPNLGISHRQFVFVSCRKTNAPLPAHTRSSNSAKPSHNGISLGISPSKIQLVKAIEAPTGASRRRKNAPAPSATAPANGSTTPEIVKPCCEYVLSARRDTATAPAPAVSAPIDIARTAEGRSPILGQIAFQMVLILLTTYTARSKGNKPPHQWH
jgi:hypothetical protein